MFKDIILFSSYLTGPHCWVCQFCGGWSCQHITSHVLCLCLSMIIMIMSIAMKCLPSAAVVATRSAKQSRGRIWDESRKSLGFRMVMMAQPCLMIVYDTSHISRSVLPGWFLKPTFLGLSWGFQPREVVNGWRAGGPLQNSWLVDQVLAISFSEKCTSSTCYHVFFW